ncbi:MAG: HAMP domain-containing histidine kinase [Lunatimonas sp.]|uniref:sensor histidine kinase n=1 Tax=Lunatimonas sp. TaxID=2060141 RepID=UPI00263B6F00|nr:HAMP domain-containing sensor histidine kinase [Lunatimonas sp.]MCC5936099.1 HAMP domain-containing histidine kinase [Lunatimonas sp.]
MASWNRMKEQIKSWFFWYRTPVMEKQIFNSMLFIIAVYLVAMGVINIFIGQTWLTLISFLTLGPLAFIYYLIRIKNRYQLSLYLFGGLSYPLITINFFLNDGVLGPTSYIFILMNVVLISIAPLKMIPGWTAVNISFFVVLYYLGTYHSSWIPANYTSENYLFIDHVLTYIGSILGITLLLTTLKQYYQFQKSEAEFKRNELALLNRDLNNLNQQKDKIIAIIAHDLRNPLNSILQTLELIDQADSLTAEEMDFIHGELLKNTKRTYRMMENILEWSSFELNRTQNRIRQVDLKSLLQDTLDIMTSIASQKQLTLNVNFNGNPEVNGETDRILLIVRNLIQNAIKFSNKGGTIWCEISSDDRQIIISVEDTGIGIPEQKITNIFQLEIKPTYGTANEKGTGMGLHICYQNALKLGGSIEVRSKEGVGSTFTLRFPAKLTSDQELLNQ